MCVQYNPLSSNHFSLCFSVHPSVHLSLDVLDKPLIGYFIWGSEYVRGIPSTNLIYVCEYQSIYKCYNLVFVDKTYGYGIMFISWWIEKERKLKLRVGGVRQAKAVVQHQGDAQRPQQQAIVTGLSPWKIRLISSGPMAHVSDIKLIRTDTTLDLSQKAEKGMLIHLLGRCLCSKSLPLCIIHAAHVGGRRLIFALCFAAASATKSF
jgi:hypothetical protein